MEALAAQLRIAILLLQEYAEHDEFTGRSVEALQTRMKIAQMRKALKVVWL